VVDLLPLGLAHALLELVRHFDAALDAALLVEEVVGGLITADHGAIVHDFEHHFTFRGVALVAADVHLVAGLLDLLFSLHVADAALGVHLLVGTAGLAHEFELGRELAH